MHLRGWGTKPDKAQAAKLWELAARLLDVKVGFFPADRGCGLQGACRSLYVCHKSSSAC